MFLTAETVRAFASDRNGKLSLAFLKENGELLSIAANSGMLLEPAALEFYKPFYENALNTAEFFPQFVRFILGIVLDLEDLGYQGDVGEKICDFVIEQRFLDYETSDTRRLETLTLLARRKTPGTTEQAYQTHLFASIDKFISNPDFFVKFNKPLFYELTHYIFFLTKYGEVEFPLQNSPIKSLTYMGILAFLDDDEDLLAEVCVCFKFLGKEPPTIWEQYIEKSLKEITISYDTSVQSALNRATDDYHVYLMLNWYLALQKGNVFTEYFGGKTPYFTIPQRGASVLSVLSDALYETQVSGRMSPQECMGTLVNLSTEHKIQIGQALSSTPLAAELLSKYSSGIFDKKALSIFGH